MRSVHVAAMLIALMAAIRAHAQTSWIESFIYIDGAFRFFGQGSKPFWAPAPTPKSTNP